MNMPELRLVDPRDVQEGQEVRLSYVPMPREAVVTGKVRRVDAYGIDVEHPGGGGYTFVPWQAVGLTAAVVSADSRARSEQS